MNRSDLDNFIRQQQSFLCVGLDPDLDRFPASLPREVSSIISFNKAIIDAVAPHCVAFKPNTAFYECYGTRGWAAFEETVAYIRSAHPSHLVIADAKRGDIGNTSTRYAKAFFENMDCHAVTVAPYMGEDSVKPFLAFENRWTILLALTSNAGAADFQNYGEPDLYLRVIHEARSWGNSNQLMFVAGATKSSQLSQLRKAAGDHYLLVPGVGAQGGDMDSVMKSAGLTNGTGVLINSSRGIIYAGSGEDFAELAGRKAQELQNSMLPYLT